MALPSTVLGFFLSFIPGSRLVDGGELQTEANLLFSTASGLTAHSGGTQAPALPLTAAINEVSVVGAGNDSVMLPIALPGMRVIIINDTAATSMQVYGQTLNPNTGVGDTIAAHNSQTQAATATGVAQAGATIAEYWCFAAGKWKQFLTG
jgi:hypothetical protein